MESAEWRLTKSVTSDLCIDALAVGEMLIREVDMSCNQTRADAQRPTPSDGPEPIRVLSVTGGGLLGVVPAAMLVRLEALGRAAYGPNYRLHHSFDMVGGTSTGAVIATCVALGLSASDIAHIYLRDAPNGFKPRRAALPFFHDRLNDDLFMAHITRWTGQQRLSRQGLNCDLTILVKNLSRAIPMAFSTMSNGLEPRHCLGAEVRGDELPLDKLLRASTAAPGLFRPAMLPTAPDGGLDLCIDGALSPFNNPAVLLNAIAMEGQPGEIVLTGLGTGSSRPRYRSERLLRQPAMRRLISGLAGTITDVVSHADSVLAHLSEQPGSRTAFKRYDLDLSDDGLRALDPSLSRRDLTEMRSFAVPKGKSRLFDIALAYAECNIIEALPLSGAGEVALRPIRWARTG